MQRLSERESISLLIMRMHGMLEYIKITYYTTRDLFNATFWNKGNTISKLTVKKQYNDLRKQIPSNIVQNQEDQRQRQF